MLTGYLFLAAGVHKLFYEDHSLIIVVSSLEELLLGAALIVGLLTRWVSIPLAVISWQMSLCFIHHTIYSNRTTDMSTPYSAWALVLR
jgi:uncharacterized membrane protein YphA (DoxX/SURF4 family)